jgi:molybdopterin-guanine dinucleotide biosynthesis protein A
MLGLVLCGGKSTRMGNDKGLLKLEATTWAQTAVDKLGELNIPVKISVNKNQHESYAAVFPMDALVVDNEMLKLQGPLLGLLSAHVACSDEDVFVLACDLPLMETSILRELLFLYHHYSSGDAFVFLNEGQAEPLCGIYTRKCLANIFDRFREGRLEKHSMKYVLENVHTRTITASEGQKKSFRNFNAHAELNGL